LFWQLLPACLPAGIQLSYRGSLIFCGAKIGFKLQIANIKSQKTNSRSNYQIPNSKFQISNKFQTEIFKFQTTKI